MVAQDLPHLLPYLCFANGCTRLASPVILPVTLPVLCQWLQVLPDNRVVVVDRANSRVKLVYLDPMETVDDQAVGGGESGDGGLCPAVDLTKPHGVCHVDGNVIAVVSHAAKTLQVGLCLFDCCMGRGIDQIIKHPQPPTHPKKPITITTTNRCSRSC
jgi:hypothetical protein